MSHECSHCRPVTDAERIEAQRKFAAAVQRAGTQLPSPGREELARATFADGVVGMETIAMCVLSFPKDSSLDGHHFAVTVEHLLANPEEKIVAELVRDIGQQLSRRRAKLPWWKRLFRK